jgi:hypothetical protein
MSETTNQNNGTIVNVKRVRRDQDAKGRDKVVLTFGLDQDGNNGLDSLLAALETYRGKQVNFDIRLEQKTSGAGAKFDAAFVIVKEMIPKDQAAAQTTFVPKGSARANAARANADKVRKAIE